MYVVWCGVHLGTHMHACMHSIDAHCGVCGDFFCVMEMVPLLITLIHLSSLYRASV
eukprot:34774_3